MKRPRNIATVSALFALTFVLHPSTFVLAQGPLTPPGAPAPTMKTLDQVEPRIDVATLPGDGSSEFVISQPGSYYLSRNVATAKNNAIAINAADVTLDLGGFELTRSASTGGSAVQVAAAAQRATVRHGSVLGSFSYGVQCLGGTLAVRVEEVAISGCLTLGILTGEGAIVRQCRVQDQAGEGIQVGQSSTISYCTVAGCQTGEGIQGLHGSTIDHCAVIRHTGTDGIEVFSGGIITECSVYNGTFTGAAIRGESGTTVARCSAYGNTTSRGIEGGAGSMLSHCAASSNTSAAATSTGISVGQGSTIIGCSADGNVSTAATLTGATGSGISTSTAVSIFQCTAHGNTGDGIRVPNTCHISGNTCQNNGSGLGGDGAGIHATGSFNRIEGNAVVQNDRGIDVDGNSNFIVRNTATGNPTNYDIVTGNAVGTIVFTPASGAISGSTGGAGVGSLDPWANFSY